MEQIIYLKMDNNTEWRCPKIKMPHNGRWQEFEDTPPPPPKKNMAKIGGLPKLKIIKND